MVSEKMVQDAVITLTILNVAIVGSMESRYSSRSGISECDDPFYPSTQSLDYNPLIQFYFSVQMLSYYLLKFCIIDIYPLFVFGCV